MFEDDSSHCKNIIVGLGGIVEEFSQGGNTRYIPGWGGATRRLIP